MASSALQRGAHECVDLVQLQRADAETQGLVEGAVRATNTGVNACAVRFTLYLDGSRAAEINPLIPAGRTATVALPCYNSISSATASQLAAD